MDIKFFPFGPGTRGQSCKNVKNRFLKKFVTFFSKSQICPELLILYLKIDVVLKNELPT